MIFAATYNGSWAPGIGDPTFVGWFTVTAYLFAAILCLRASGHLDLKRPLAYSIEQKERRYWRMQAAILFALGVNKQLDLQTAITVWGRWLAVEQGWYEERRFVQKIFVVLVVVLGIAVIAALARLCSGAWQRNSLACLGMVFLVSFVMIRAASFHHVDLFLGLHALGIRFNAIFELGGIGCIAVAAIGRLSMPKRKRGNNRDLAAQID